MEAIDMFDWAYEAEDIVNLLEGQSQPSLDVVLHHPFLWRLHGYIEFLCLVSDFMEPENEFNNSLHDDMFEHRVDTFGIDSWPGRVPTQLYKKQGGDKVYYGDRPSSLLRFIRNILNHHEDVKTKEKPNGVKLTSVDHEWLAEDKYDALHSFRKTFPSFLTDLWTFIGQINLADMGPLRRFYE